MEIPPYADFRLPLLKALEDGEKHKLTDLHGRICDDMGLSEEQRTRLVPNRRYTYIYSRVGWTATRLKDAGLLSRLGGGIVQITQSGKDVLKDPPLRIDHKYLSRISGSENSRRADSAQLDDEQTPEDHLHQGFEGIRKALHAELEDAVMSVSPLGFEQLVLELFKKMGYGKWIEHTGRSGDGGIDGIIRKDRLGLGEIRVQAKRWTGPVGARPVREFMGVLGGKEGIFITTSAFGPNVRKEASNNVVLIDGKELVSLMDEYGVGVSEVETMKINKLDSEYFDQFK